MNHQRNKFQEFLDGPQVVMPANSVATPVPGSAGLLPGTFNPLHDGHRAMRDVAQRELGMRVDFEIAIAPLDKTPLSADELARRTGQFQRDEVVWVSKASTFDEKSRCFPNTVFVVGVDTIARVADRTYYGADEQQRDRAVDVIRESGGRFLVCGRLHRGRFQTGEHLQLPPSLAELCDFLSEAQFRIDISSTDLRT